MIEQADVGRMDVGRAGLGGESEQIVEGGSGLHEGGIAVVQIFVSDYIVTTRRRLKSDVPGQ